MVCPSACSPVGMLENAVDLPSAKGGMQDRASSGG